jgi:hypothetical protein
LSVAHDPDVPFAAEIVTRDRINLEEWECWTVRDGGVTHYYARGPCPVCGGPTQGSIDDVPKPIESLGVHDREPEREPSSDDEPVSIPVNCRCGVTVNPIKPPADGVG